MVRDIGAALIGIAVLLALPSPLTAQPEEESIRAGGRIWAARCSNCHFVPDSSIARDRIWTEMIQTTA